MKNIIIIIVLAISALGARAQFTSAVLQASGLTCAMCSKAINNSLEQLSFVQSVEPDIKNSAFNVQFKSNTAVDIDQLKNAVEDAGFSVARLKISGRFNNLAVKNDEHVQVGGTTFHFLNINDQTLHGEKQITIVDKQFVTVKELKKFHSASHLKCVQTGKAASCCLKEGIPENTRIYHVTI